MCEEFLMILVKASPSLSGRIVKFGLPSSCYNPGALSLVFPSAAAEGRGN